jgi:hypothetical protein
MAHVVNLRIKTSDVRIPVFHIEFEGMATKQNSLTSNVVHHVKYSTTSLN